MKNQGIKFTLISERLNLSIDNELFKKLNDNIWEFRTLYNGKAYRLFAFWDKVDGKDFIVITTYGILKKTQKTPSKEIDKSETIRKEYLKNKQK